MPHFCFGLWFYQRLQKRYRPHKNPFSLKPQAVTQVCRKASHAGEKALRARRNLQAPSRYSCGSTNPSPLFWHVPAVASQFPERHQRLLPGDTGGPGTAASGTPHTPANQAGGRPPAVPFRAFPTSRAGTLAPQGALARPAPPTPPSSSMAPGTTSSTRTKHGCRRGIARVQDGASRRCFVRIGFKMVASPPRALLPGSKMPSSTSPTCLASCPAPQRP